jgi:hypothetical protein
LNFAFIKISIKKTLHFIKFFKFETKKSNWLFRIDLEFILSVYVLSLGWLSLLLYFKFGFSGLFSMEE